MPGAFFDVFLAPGRTPESMPGAFFGHARAFFGPSRAFMARPGRLDHSSGLLGLAATRKARSMLGASLQKCCGKPLTEGQQEIRAQIPDSAEVCLSQTEGPDVTEQS